jgi:hypothetical protein
MSITDGEGYIALIVVAAAGLRLVGVAFLMALSPRYCLHLFENYVRQSGALKLASSVH